MTPRRAPARRATLALTSPAIALAVVFGVATVVAADPAGVVPAVVRTAFVVVLLAAAGHATGLSLVPDGLTAGGRLILSLGAGLAVPVLAALLLSVTPWGIGRTQLLVAIITIFVVVVVAGVRRRPDIWSRGWTSPRADGRLALGALVYLAALAGGAAAVGIRVDVASQPAADITQLSVDPAALAEGRLLVRVESHEHDIVLFRLDVTVGGSVRETRTETVRDGEEWVVDVPGDLGGERVVILLHRVPDVDPYRTLAVSVPSAGSSP
jgi:uncharacterized membrane protein